MIETSESTQSLVSEPKKRRSQGEKVGRLKYIIELEQDILKELGIQRLTLRKIVQGLDIGGYLVFDRSYVLKVCCKDDVDAAILEELFNVGGAGILPKDLAQKLNKYRLNRFQVSYRIQAMNKRLDLEIAQKVAVKRGLKWALTDFSHDAFDQTKEEIVTQTDRSIDHWE